ncbi:MAG: ammonium transporter [Coriobacteriia bacterium]|nr:ammonium transporter [Coriobacteriia bacterium]
MYDTGTTAFMLFSTAVVLMMSPALALFYGGLSRRKNVLNTMAMTLLAMAVVGCSWILLGDSLAYGGADAYDENGNLVNLLGLFVGGGDRLLSSWSVDEVVAANQALGDGATLAGSAWGQYPGALSVAFQATFAMVTTAIISGSLAGRVKFGAWAFLVCVWPLLIYAPMAHMVWGGGLIGNPNAIGAIDFAGGTAVHICSGLSGLVLCVILGARHGFRQMSYRPHNVPFVMLGGGLLFVGWFGFNGGSALVADGNAALAILNTVVAACAAAACWAACEQKRIGKVTVVGLSTGFLAGLVVITPACGFVEPWAAVVMGIIVSPICFACISTLKQKLGYDDALDAFGCHGVGGMVGAVLTGVFCRPDLSWTDFGGLLYTGDPTLLIAQVLGVVVTVVFVGVGTAVLGLAAKALFGNSLRVNRDAEVMGLDVVANGEAAYPAFNGLD